MSMKVVLGIFVLLIADVNAAGDRANWVNWLSKVASPVLQAGAMGNLTQSIPVAAGTDSRKPYQTLEAVGRLLVGMAPWLESTAKVDAAEDQLRSKYRSQALLTIASLVDPKSPSKVNFKAGEQIIVDAAFLSQAFLRAPNTLWRALPATVQDQVISCFVESRMHMAPYSNHLLFAAMIEAFLAQTNKVDYDKSRIDYAIHSLEKFYKGDGAYGDGDYYHFDYYNSFVMHPMLLDILKAVGSRESSWNSYSAKMLSRAQRYAVVQERMIMPDGAVPPSGRSLAYRCGVLHALAQISLMQQLPSSLNPAQVRGAIGAVIGLLLGKPGTFDSKGWLRIGFAGYQPSIGETYISTGSLYLCSAAFLPLGLGPETPFWSNPDAQWTTVKVYSGQDVPPDHAVDVTLEFEPSF